MEEIDKWEEDIASIIENEEKINDTFELINKKYKLSSSEIKEGFIDVIHEINNAISNNDFIPTPKQHKIIMRLSEKVYALDTDEKNLNHELKDEIAYYKMLKQGTRTKHYESPYQKHDKIDFDFDITEHKRLLASLFLFFCFICYVSSGPSPAELEQKKEMLQQEQPVKEQNINSNSNNSTGKPVDYSKEQADDIINQMHSVGITNNMIKDLKIISKEFEINSSDDDTLYAFMQCYVKDSKHPNVLKITAMVNEDGKINDLQVFTKDLNAIHLIENYEVVGNVNRIH